MKKSSLKKKVLWLVGERREGMKKKMEFKVIQSLLQRH